MEISLYQGQFIHGSYDKRNDFNFNVVNFPNLTGNVPTVQSYGVYTSQLVRFCDINISHKGFRKDVAILNDSLLNQGFKKKMLQNTYDEFCNKYIFKWAKYNKDISDLRIM